MAEMRIGRERGCLVEQRLTHADPQHFRELVVPRFEVFADFWVRDALQAGGPEAAVRKQRCELKERESIRGEYIERISKKLISPRAEIVEVPAMFQEFGEFCDPDKLRLPLSLGVQVIAAHIASTGKYHGERSSDRLANMQVFAATALNLLLRNLSR